MRSDRRSRLPIAGFHRRLACVCALVFSLVGCAEKPPADDPDAVADYEQTNDPLEPTNRVFYAVNNGVDTVILRPLALTYGAVVPRPVRTGVRNVLTNLGSPIQLANDLMEAKPKRAGDTAMRFLLNTTVGLLGVFDVATSMGYPDHDADFGMTLASWGVPEGPFLFLPVLGPSDPRDAIGFGVDRVIDPFMWIGNGNIPAIHDLKWAWFSLNAISARERLEDPIQQIKKTALDPYATFRSLYRQHRAAQIETMKADSSGTVPAYSKKTSD